VTGLAHQKNTDSRTSTRTVRWSPAESEPTVSARHRSRLQRVLEAHPGRHPQCGRPRPLRDRRRERGDDAELGVQGQGVGTKSRWRAAGRRGEDDARSGATGV